VEATFRRFCTKDAEAEPVFKIIEFSFVKHLFPNVIESVSLHQKVVKICRLFIKIRGNQKSRKMSSDLSLSFDQNISLQKTLKNSKV